MAKFEAKLSGSFDEVIEAIESGVLRGTASFEDGSDFDNGTTRCAVRVFERYSVVGSNRVSLNVTLIGDNNGLFLSAITSGGSQAMFFKVNTLGEGSFLDRLVDVVEPYVV